MKGKAKAMLISVGGTLQPIIYSIVENRPERIIFFASRETYDSVTAEILPEVAKELGRIPPHEIVVTGDAQNVGECLLALRRDVPQALRKLCSSVVHWPDLIDYTGGTKSMSAAMISSSSRYPCRFSYIGSDDPQARSKGGKGVVIDGKEKCFIRENPWNRVGYFEAREIMLIFNHGCYERAARDMEALSMRVDDEDARTAFERLARIFKGFALWDIFNHKKARDALNQATVRDLKILAGSDRIDLPLQEFSEQVEICEEIIRGIRPGKLNRSLVWDLLSNALRRAELEGKYEDAVARCYSAIEKWGAFILKNKHGISSSDARPELLPESIRKEYIKRYNIRYEVGDGRVEERISFGLGATYRLLNILGDPLGRRFKERADITRHLAARNETILAHGTVPATSKDFYALFKDALFLLDCSKEDLVRFPTFPL